MTDELAVEENPELPAVLPPVKGLVDVLLVDVLLVDVLLADVLLVDVLLADVLVEAEDVVVVEEDVVIGPKGFRLVLVNIVARGGGGSLTVGGAT